jgi:hypothetical protein
VSDGADGDEVIDAYQAFSEGVDTYLESLELVYRYLRQRGIAEDYDPDKLFVDVTGVEDETQQEVLDELQSLFEGFDVDSVVDTAVRHVGSAYEEACRLRDLQAALSDVTEASYDSVDAVLSEVLEVLESNAEDIGEISEVFADSVEELDERADTVARQLEAAKEHSDRQLLLTGLAFGGALCGGVMFHDVITSYIQYVAADLEANVEGLMPSIALSVAASVFVTFPLVLYYVQRDVNTLDELERRKAEVGRRRKHFIALTKSVLDVAVDLQKSER